MVVRAHFELPDLRSRADIQSALDAMTAFNVGWLESHPGTPRLLRAGVSYQREFPREKWRTIPIVQRYGVGDCEDLASWAAAESGGRAIPIRQRSGNWHIVTRLPDGRIVDPSKSLGMRPLRRNEVRRHRAGQNEQDESFFGERGPFRTRERASTTGGGGAALLGIVALLAAGMAR